MINTSNCGETIHVGDSSIETVVHNNQLLSLGAVCVGDTALRNPATRFLPWFDTYNGDIFRSFTFRGVSEDNGVTRVRTRATSDPDVLFRERRDSSGDLCFRAASWDAEPLEADLDICFAPAHSTVDGIAFTGFKYWFEYASDAVAIHRLVDRQTWEIGGSLDDVTICLRNWLTPPSVRIARATEYSTVGLDKWATLLPGNLWARWSLLPAFDMQYGRDGVLLAWFDQVSLIRTVIESAAGEDAIRCLDMHLFAQSTTVCTDPKTVLWSPATLDSVDALNLWTAVHDQEQARACAQFEVPTPEPPSIVFSENVWHGMRFDSTYNQALNVAAEFQADYLFIDPVWESQQAYKETLDALIPPAQQQQVSIFNKFWHQNMCVILDFEVAECFGGERELKNLCDRAQAQGVKVISWLATHYSLNSSLQFVPELQSSGNTIFATRESGLHPDTGNPGGCWTANLHSPVTEHLRQQILGVCERTGLAGFLWDSFSNMGWWQLNYRDGSMRPQYDKMAGLYADFINHGLYIQPEAIVGFSNSSCCGLHGGNIYADELLPYSYRTNISFWAGDGTEHGAVEQDILCGKQPIDLLFRCVAHQRIPNMEFHRVPREDWDALAVAQIKELFHLYKTYRHLMVRRRVLKDGRGVLWMNDEEQPLLFSFTEQDAPQPGIYEDLTTLKTLVEGERLQANRVYRIAR